MVSLPQGSQLARYQILDRIGRAVWLQVFKAHDPELDRYGAVKVLPSSSNTQSEFRTRRVGPRAVDRPNAKGGCMIGLLDPEGTEKKVLHDLVDFKGKDVIEVGCGDGRMTLALCRRCGLCLCFRP